MDKITEQQIANAISYKNIEVVVQQFGDNDTATVWVHRLDGQYMVRIGFITFGKMVKYSVVRDVMSANMSSSSNELDVVLEEHRIFASVAADIKNYVAARKQLERDEQVAALRASDLVDYVVWARFEDKFFVVGAEGDAMETLLQDVIGDHKILVIASNVFSVESL